jgi:hypothetical protein
MKLLQNELYYYNAAAKALDDSDQATAEMRAAYGGFTVDAIRKLALDIKELDKKKVLESKIAGAAAKGGRRIGAGAGPLVFTGASGSAPMTQATTLTDTE